MGRRVSHPARTLIDMRDIPGLTVNARLAWERLDQPGRIEAGWWADGRWQAVRADGGRVVTNLAAGESEVRERIRAWLKVGTWRRIDLGSGQPIDVTGEW